MKKLLILGMSLALLAGCNTLKKATGQLDDTVLPGQRQEILPPDQQQARDPNVVGNQGTAAATAPGAPGTPVMGQPAAPAHAVASGPTCDPKVDLCPETASPEPLPPPSPVIPEKEATATGKKTIKTASTAKSTAPKTASAGTTAGVATTGTGTATDGTVKTADATVLKKKKKKKPVAPVDAGTTAAPATNDSTPPVPSAPQPDAQ